MYLFRNIIAACLLIGSVAACAESPPSVLVKTDVPANGTTSTLSLQNTPGSSCTAPSVGICGTCNISCPSGQAAMCRAGLSIGKQSDSSCLQPPDCKCH